MDDYYHRMAEVYRIAAIDRELYRIVDGECVPIARERVLIPVVDTDSLSGAALLLAILAYPDEPQKRKHFIDCVISKLIKTNIPRNTPEWKACQHLTSISNKALDQFLGIGKKSAGYRINMRMRAADALWQKLYSNNDPAQQEKLKIIASQVASHNSRYFSAFYSTPNAEGDPADSFIKRILWPSKPVIHVAMALNHMLRELNLNDRSIIELVMEAEKWLVATLFMAECIRVEFGSFFPRRDSQYLKVKEKNFSVDLEQTIIFLPIIDKLGK